MDVEKPAFLLTNGDYMKKVFATGLLRGPRSYRWISEDFYSRFETTLYYVDDKNFIS